ncbi:hypothetical protein EHO57_13950 [Leptospira langatensis]|uniref:Uncharacterized protein n=1 Tax=Leptospira langatensis TaxID=2484983 RepID=A0A5R2ATS8_9LEPT|nr:hypothetical protein [Leptospira langatensis]TGJ99859.1 hypothetical protein EHO57_13950 [Leptospira langatensis]
MKSFKNDFLKDNTLRAYIDGAVANEISDRQSAVGDLQNQIDTLSTAVGNDVATLESDLSDEIAARTNAVAGLQGDINSEATTRQNADSSLTNNLNNETIARQNGDDVNAAAIAAETLARQNADAALQTDIEARIPNSEKGAVSGVATLGSDGLLSISQRPPSSGGGGGGTGSIVWQEGAVSPPSGVYNNWADVYAQILAVPGLKTVVVDSDVSLCHVPAGTFDLTGVIFVGKRVPDGIFSPTANLRFDPGAVLSHLPEEIHRVILEVNPLSGTPLWTSTGNTTLKLVDSQILSKGTESALLIAASHYLSLVLDNSSLDNSSTTYSPIFNIVGGLIVFANSGTTKVGNDCFQGAGQAISIIGGGWNSYTSGKIWGSQSAFTGSEFALMSRTAYGIVYDNAIGGDQHIAATILENVIREINPKKTGRLDQKGTILTGDGSNGLTAKAPGTNKNAIIYDSSTSTGFADAPSLVSPGMKTVPDYIRQSSPATPLLSAGSQSLDCSTANLFRITGGTMTLTLTNMVENEVVTVKVESTGSAYVITWAGYTFEWQDGIVPSPTSSSGRKDLYTFQMIGGIISAACIKNMA